MSEYKDMLMNYRFKVLVDNTVVAFSKVSGLDMEVETELIPDGGCYRSGHIMESPPKSPGKLRMEGGLASAGAGKLLKNLRPGMYLKQGIVVMVLGRDGSVKQQYLADQAYVTRWELSELSGDGGSVLVNTFEAAYTALKVTSS